jgi:penicillin-binding protein 2
VLLVFLLGCGLVLVGRLLYLQMVDHRLYRERAEENATLTIDQIPARGLIYDRYGRLIVDNQPTFSVQITPAAFDTMREGEFEYLADRLDMPVGQIRERLIGAWPFAPVTVKENVPFHFISRLEEEKEDHPGVSYRVEIHRIYLPTITMPHVIGYLNQITESRISYYRTGEFANTDYKIGENVGASGVEKFYEIELRGEKGYHQFLVDARGTIVRDLGTVKRPLDGYSLYLTVDMDLQRYIEAIMGRQKGSIIVMDVRTGEILAATSKPDYNVLWFVNGITMDKWKELNENPDKPMFNRIVQSGYAPGSTFKMITAAAGLEEGLVTPETYFSCKGVFMLGGNRFRCWNPYGHGGVNLSYAITQSCDIYFYNLAWKLGINKLARYARMFGLGEMTGVDLPNERRGLIPTTDYFDSRYGRDNWKAGTVVNLGIGQGEILVTPVQMVQYVSIFANRGTYYTPHFVRYVEDQAGIHKAEFTEHRVPVRSEHMDLIRYAMWTVVNAYSGTGKKAAIKAAHAAGKTGTAENVHGNYHGWFIGFAPYTNPEIAVVVLMENGGEGSDVAAPMSARVMSYYFSSIRGRKPFDPGLLKERTFQTLTDYQVTSFKP